MSLALECGTRPLGVEVKTYGSFLKESEPENTVHIRSGTVELEITLPDFLAMVEYVLTNTAVEEDDPRLHFVEQAKTLHLVERYGGRALATKDHMSMVKLSDLHKAKDRMKAIEDKCSADLER